MTTLLLLRHATRPFASLAPFGGRAAEAAARKLFDGEARGAREAARLDAALHEAAGPKIEDGNEHAARIRLAILAVKRAVHNGRIWREDDLAAASPGFSPAIAEALAAHRVTLLARDALAIAWEQAFLAELDAGRRAIVESVSDPLVSFGIALAGRPLIAKIRSLGRRDPAGWGHGERHVAAKALAYIARFATKTSPNSVFCATAVAQAAGDRAAIAGRPGI